MLSAQRVECSDMWDVTCPAFMTETRVEAASLGGVGEGGAVVQILGGRRGA